MDELDTDAYGSKKKIPPLSEAFLRERHAIVRKKYVAAHKRLSRLTNEADIARADFRRYSEAMAHLTSQINKITGKE